MEAVTQQYPEERGYPGEVENNASVRFVFFPFFALYPAQPTEHSDVIHPPRAMAQYFDQLEDTYTCDTRQILRKLNEKSDPNCDIVHVFHIWSLTINNSTWTKMGPVLLLIHHSDHDNFCTLDYKGALG